MKKLIIFLCIAFSMHSQTRTANTIMIKHTAYEICYDTVLRMPIWTHYVLTSEHANYKNNVDRTAFRKDTLIAERVQMRMSDYSKVSKIYDRGHLAPSNDFRWNTNVQYDAMLLTNCSYQAIQFNRGTWHALELYIEKLAKTKNVEIWTGCIYANGSNIPTHYWKVIKVNRKFFAWKCPNAASTTGSIAKYYVDYATLIVVH